ncbi:MAG: amidohydrolase family protein [Actinomycetota bacterium]|nr:amidohydrolase family protein [Actinomycetota bacterium]
MSQPPSPGDVSAAETSADLLVVGGDIITMDDERRIILGGAVAVSGSTIVGVGATDELRAAFPGTPEHDASGCVVTPGFANTHQHVTGDPLARSCQPDDLQPGASIFEWAIPLNDAHGPEDDEVAALLTYVDSLRHGVTTVIEAGTVGHLEPTARAARAAGIRAGLGVWGWDIEHGPFTAPTAETLARQAHTLDLLPPDDRVHGWVTLVGHDLASDELLGGAADLARARGAHMTMHISPTSNDAEAYLARTGRRPLVHLDHLGALGPHLVLAHAVWLDDAEADLLATTGTAVAYCPWAYLHHGQGVCSMGRHMALHQRGVPVGLGCDAPNANDGVDILDAARLAVGLAKDTAIDPTWASAYDGLEMATLGGARAAGLGGRTGAIAVGHHADLVVHDATTTHWTPRGNVVQQLIWSAQGNTVRDVLVDGHLVVADGRCTTVDEDELRAEAAARQASVLARAGLTVPQRWPVVDGRPGADRPPTRPAAAITYGVAT